MNKLLKLFRGKEVAKQPPTARQQSVLTPNDVPESYSWKEARAMGAFSEDALSWEDTKPLAPGLETSLFEEDTLDGEEQSRAR